MNFFGGSSYTKGIKIRMWVYGTKMDFSLLAAISLQLSPVSQACCNEWGFQFERMTIHLQVLMINTHKGFYLLFIDSFDVFRLA